MSLNAHAVSCCDGTMQHPCIVQDHAPNDHDIKNFRSTEDLINAHPHNATGLAGLNMSGSGALSESGWKKLKTDLHVSYLVDVDLRQETHGYINGGSVTLMIKHDWINHGKTHAQVLRAEKKWLNQLKQHKTLQHVLTSAQFKAQEFSQGKTISVQQIQSEKELVAKLGMRYLRLTVTDHLAPDDQEVDRFVEWVRHLPAHTWVHFHCRGGSGRTTTFMAMYDMLHNANRVSLADILQRQAIVKPYYDLSITQRKHARYAPYYKQRLAFIKKFYDYAQSYLNGERYSWLEY